MRFTIPASFPLPAELLTHMLDAVLPDCEAMGCNRTAFGYTKALFQVAEALDLEGSTQDGRTDCRLFRLLDALDGLSRRLLGRGSALLTPYEDSLYRRGYANTLYRFIGDGTPAGTSSWGKWLDPVRRTAPVFENRFQLALLFAYLLLSRDVCRDTREPILSYCLSLMGITGKDRPFFRAACAFGWEEGAEARWGTSTFSRLENRAVKALAGALLCALQCVYSPEETAQDVCRAYGDWLQETFAQPLAVVESLDAAETVLYQATAVMIPRSIKTTRRLLQQDIFVAPDFTRAEQASESPLAPLSHAARSRRTILVASTGMGKSSFLQAAAHCILAPEREESPETKAALEGMARELEAPAGMTVLMVSGALFTSCYESPARRAWTEDLAALFLRDAWAQGEMGIQTPDYTEDLQEELRSLAREGRLVLFLDSYDEIPAGAPRTAYLQALAAFTETYCRFPEPDAVGAHILMASREMSPETMERLKAAADIPERDAFYTLAPLTYEKQCRLAQGWKKFRRGDEGEFQELLQAIRENHFYRDFARNPYMLSVLINFFGRDMGAISERIITDLLVKLVRGGGEDPVVQYVLEELRPLLQQVAMDTVLAGQLHFSRALLEGYLDTLLEDEELDARDLAAVKRQIHHILVVKVGLIVPADQEDDAYQFINDTIRCALAAAGLQQALERNAETEALRQRLSAMPSLSRYAGVMVPLICKLGTENTRLAEALIGDMALRDAEGPETSALTEAFLDLLLRRYGDSIACVSIPGTHDVYWVNRAQRLLLLRLSAAFTPALSPQEQEALAASPASRRNPGWLSLAGRSLP